MSILKGFEGPKCFSPQEVWNVQGHNMPQLRVKGSMTEEAAAQVYRLTHGIKDDVPIIVKRLKINGYGSTDRQRAAAVDVTSAAVRRESESAAGAGEVGEGS